MLSVELAAGDFPEHPPPCGFRIERGEFGIVRTIPSVEKQNLAGVGCRFRHPFEQDEQRHFTVAPQEMLRHRQGDFAAIAMGRRNSGPSG